MCEIDLVYSRRYGAMMSSRYGGVCVVIVSYKVGTWTVARTDFRSNGVG